MTSRTIAAETTGPVTIDAALLGHHGTITVRTEADCERATVTITTADEDGDAADAVKRATLRPSGTGGVVASVEGRGGSAGGTTVITGGGIQSIVRGNSGSTIVIGGNISGGNIVSGGGDVVINGVRFTGGNGATVVQGSPPIEITAVVPEGSSLISRTHSADIETLGNMLHVGGHTQSGDFRVTSASQVVASTQSGDVRVEGAANIAVKTKSGDIRLGRTDVVEADTMSGDITISDFGGSARLKTMSGDVRVHATAGGDLSATTMSGDIDVTATQAALGDDLDVITSSMSGRVRAPQRRMGGNQPRRRR
ncbi:DUF4097 domain-containing protein (plasmid) [Streptomyces sp. NBC_01310]|uniref:DUF4097 family beta strand repeat-containing protein n=1 Tax=Streptomyces sp. NBC_01310 TaxID=2903820 RepID=UPI0035B5DC15|nr:DUF4097 domain-containing protein [Streptomyces sp. NBC_01310]